MTAKHFLLFLFTITISVHFSAQNAKKRDSLLNLFSKEKNDSMKVMLLLTVSTLYDTDDFDSTFLYLEKANNLAKENLFAQSAHKYRFFAILLLQQQL